MASPVTVPNSFTAGTDAVAAEVNANFTSLVDYINNNMVTDDGTVNIGGTQVVNNLTVNGTLTTSGDINATVNTLKGNVLSDDGNVIVLENGTDGSDATFRGDIINTSGTVILDVSAASFAGDITGNAATATSATTAGSATTATSATTASSATSATNATNATNVSTGSTSDSTAYLALLNTAGGTQQVKYDTTIYYNASSNQLFAPSVRATGGSSSSPSFAVEDNDTGFYSSSGGTMAASCNSTGVTEWSTSAFKPFGNGSKNLGVNGAAWNTVYATNTTISTSDDRLKVMIEDSLGLDFVKDLNPYSGVWAEPGWDSGQYEWISAQNIRAALDAHGRPYDVGMWKVQTEDPTTGEPIVDGMQSVSYEGLVPVLVKAIKELAVRVEALEAA